jgi:hypothetical protein
LSQDIEWESENEKWRSFETVWTFRCRQSINLRAGREVFFGAPSYSVDIARKPKAKKTLSERRGGSGIGPDAYREYVEGPEMRNETCSQGILSRSRSQFHFSG